MSLMKISLFISGSKLNFEDITNQLEIKPTVVRKKEDWPVPSIEAGIAADVWAYRMDHIETELLSKPVDDLQAVFLPLKEKVRELCGTYSAEAYVEVVIHTEPGSLPSLTLSRENIQFLAQINADFGVDLYEDMDESGV